MDGVVLGYTGVGCESEIVISTEEYGVYTTYIALFANEYIGPSEAEMELDQSCLQEIESRALTSEYRNI